MILMDYRVKPGNDELVRRRNSTMRVKSVRLPLVLLLAALPLAGCFSRNEPPPYAGAGLAQDDDMYCRAGGKVAVGSPDYVYCRKDRDAQRNLAVTRGDRKQRDLADWMLNHPD